MGKRISHDEYIELMKINNPNLEVVGTYVNAKTKILHRCKKHDYLFEKYPYNALKGEGCKQCANDLMASRRVKTQEQYVLEVKNINPNIDVLEQYLGANTPIKHKCLIHNYIWSVSPVSILQGCGCNQCGIEKSSSSRRKTHSDYVEQLSTSNPNIEVLEEYKGALSKILHRCKIHNYEWYVTPANLLYHTGCPKCSGQYRKTHDDYVEEISIKNPNVVVCDKYIDAKTPIKHKCLIHDYEWDIAPTGVLNGNSCPICHIEKISISKSKTHEEYLSELHNIHPHIIPIEKYNGALVPIRHRCKIDNHEWTTSPSSVLRHNCPVCSLVSHGELKIKKYFDNNNIKYDYQKRFSDCKNIRTLSFDFYLPDYDMCIEYDGEQHFFPVDFAGKGKEWAENIFNNTKLRDKIKDDYCMEKGINLIRIPYYENLELQLNKLFT